MATLSKLFQEQNKRSLVISPVETSIFDLLKSGPGPSSSHTIGPMKAGYDFLCLSREKLPSFKQKPNRFLVRLFGSLSATGKGHGTCSAVLAGLLGHSPEKCPAGLLKEISNNPDEHYTQMLGEIPITLSLHNIIYDNVVHDFPYNNTLIIELMDSAGETLLEREYYSVGGGFIQWKGWKAPTFGKPVHPYQSMRDLQRRLEQTGLTIHELLLDNETAITG